MAGRSRGFNRGRTQRRESLWLFFEPVITVMTATGGTLTHSLNAAALALRPFTIVRTHIELLLKSDQTAATEDQVGAFGMAVVSDQASAIGVTAIPTPDTDAGSDLWFIHKYVMQSWVDDSAGAGGLNSHGWTLDSKAMRKVEDGQDIVAVTEMDSATSSGISLWSAGRMLIKTH